MTRAARYRLVAALYGSQFVPLAFFLFALSAVLRQRGVPLGRIGLIQLVALVWVVKFAWAPLVDRWGSRRYGHYRPWLIATQTLMVLALLALSRLDVVRDLRLVVLFMVGLAVLSATQDIATDATAVRLLKPSERGFGNGIQKAAGYFGLMVGGGGGLVAYDHWGWAPAMFLLAALTAVPLPLLLVYREPGMTTAASRRHQVPMRTPAGFFHQPGAVRWAFVVLPVYLAGIAVAYPLVTPMLVDSGWPLDGVGTVWIIGGGGVAIVAALVAGGLLSATRRRPALVGLALAQVAAIATLLLLAHSTGGVLVGLAAVVLLSGAYAAVGTARLHDQHGLEPGRLGGDRLHRPGLLRTSVHAGRGRGRPGASRCPRVSRGPHRGRAPRPRRHRRGSPGIPGPADRRHARSVDTGSGPGTMTALGARPLWRSATAGPPAAGAWAMCSGLSM